MLNFWRSHVDYQSFSESREKLDSLNLDTISVLLAPYYSNTNRPAKVSNHHFKWWFDFRPIRAFYMRA